MLIPYNNRNQGEVFQRNLIRCLSYKCHIMNAMTFVSMLPVITSQGNKCGLGMVTIS